MTPEAVAPVAPQPPAPAVEPAVALVQRETLAPVFNAVASSAQPLPLPALQALVSAQSSALQDPQSVPAQRLVQSVQVQDPQATAPMILQQGLEALQAFSQALAVQPQDRPLSGTAPLQQAAADAGVAAPQVPLQSLPLETVAEAVAWLQARDLPPQRPLVEAVAVFLQQDQNALPAVQRAVSAAESLPPQVLASQPELKAAVETARQALDGAAIHPEQPQLTERLQQWASQQGLNLEMHLAEDKALPAPAQAFQAPHADASASTAQRPALRPALQQLEQQLKQAFRNAEEPSTSGALQSALRETQSANRSLSAVPLQAQSAPAFDTVHMPLPVALGQALGGQLSVTWRNGRDRQLNEKDPVSVAVALNTGSLGKVKVLLQVWKDAASARVVAEDPETADFLAGGADDLKAGFAERTPFKLQSLDFTAEAAPERGGGLEASGPGLTLSA
jgi:hypothetical protein